ncbi:TonB-dependent receptor [Sphingomonas sp. Leaf407]|uniref:TonB-dependent receptor n=1 Tax=unclassified Sphingomonas TaxID=196159 RepID=UPI0006F1C8ED|nr:MULTISPECIES: TonB-dependent receptor [unclassified Sphingomonas]KQN37548.1 TonB-dependent receptor [Sphingomonas sp. Leaf42]KQT27916.1 TonB-dependent receptor [Sphingomonas sp. Leaf407]
MSISFWFASVAPLALIAQQAAARDVPVAAPDVATTEPVAADGEGDEIVVLGFGQTRQVQTITAADLERLTPGTSPLKAAAKLPGVNFQSADAFGAYEWSTRISLRGFNQNQLGFTFDGVPLGDMSYGNVNGLHVSRAVISENLASTTVAQGAGALGTASTSNLGGTLAFVSRAPSDEADLVASGTYGSNDTIRAFARIDSGDLGGGLKGYLSYGYLTTDKWKGFGTQRQHQASAKLVKEIDTRGSITAFVNFSDRRENDYQDLSYDIIARRGLRADNISNDYPLAVQIGKVYQNQVARSGYAAANNGSTVGFVAPWTGAGFIFPAGFGTVDDAYYDAAGLRRDWLGGFTVDAKLTSALTLTSTSYYHHNKGQGSWITPYSPTPAGALGPDGVALTASASSTAGLASPLGFRTTEYGIDRAGNLTRVVLTTGPNRFEAGGWVESNSFQQARRFYGMNDGATAIRNARDFQRNAYRTQWDGKYDTATLQYHVADTLDLGDLTLSGGWKGMRVQNRANLRVGTLVAGRIEARDWFLPQAAALYRLGGGAEVFASYTENMRAFVSSATTGPFATTQNGFDAIRSTLKPERSTTVEGGVRLRSGGLQLSAVGYHVDFADRLLGFANGAGIIGNPPTLNNAGSVRSYGAELAASYRVMPPLTLFASYSYNKATYQDDVRNAAGVVLQPIAGKAVVDTPEHMAKGEIAYDDDRFFARVGGDYMSKRFFTYLNDRSVGARVLVDASIGYRLTGAGGVLEGLAIEGSVTNLTDKAYVATVGSNGYTASGDNQTLLAGAPRQWFVTLRRGF